MYGFLLLEDGIKINMDGQEDIGAGAHNYKDDSNAILDTLPKIKEEIK